MSYETDDKMVSHPDHYKSGKYEVIDIIEEFTKDLTGIQAVDTGNAIKYILRWRKKNGVQDVKKAIWYLTHLVEQLENDEKKSEPKEYDGADERCRTCTSRFETPENDAVCEDCFGHDHYTPDLQIDKEDPDLCVKSHKVTCPTTGDTITVPDGEPWSCSDEDKGEDHNCNTCEYESQPSSLEPCKSCMTYFNWTPKKEEDHEKAGTL